MGWRLGLGPTLLLALAACTGESSSEDERAAGGTSGAGPTGAGGSVATGGAGGSGAATGGATAGGTGGAVGGGAAGEPSTGGSGAIAAGTGGQPPDAGAGAAGLAGNGAEAGSAGDDAGAGGAGGGGGTGGSGNVSFVDPVGDASSPDIDLIRGAFYRDGEFLEFRMWFAGAPLSDGASFAISDVRWSLSVARIGAGLSLRFIGGPSLDLGLDACAHVLIDEASGLLIIRIPRTLFSTTTTVSLYASRASANGADRVESVPWTFLAYPGAHPNALPACEAWRTARTSTLAFRDISLGDGYGCGVTLAGAVVCWGQAAALSALGSPPAGSYESVSVSVHSWWDPDVYVCALRSDRQIVCWGGAAPSVTGTFGSMGDPFGCAIRDNGDLSCVDMGTGGNEIRSVPGPIAEVVGAGLDECHRTEAGGIVCLTQGMAPAGTDFIGLAFGSQSRACGLHGDGRLDCEGASALPFRFQSIDAGGQSYTSFPVGCGLTQTGSPICWGEAGVVAAVHPGPFVRLEVSNTTEGMCGFRADSTLVCWDYSHVGGYPVPATTPP